MKNTLSEDMFEKFYHENSFEFSRIMTESNIKTPDYDVFPKGNRVVVEVKELQTNNDDKAAWREARKRGVFAAWSDPSSRIRQKIGEAYKQLKCRSEGLSPAVLVLFDNGTFGGIDATDIKNAMYGDETVHVTHSSDGNIDIVPLQGGGRKCTENDNRSLSAVSLLWSIGNTVQLSIFHNVFTKCPLPYNWFAVGACRQYSIALECHSGFSEWHLIQQ